MLQNPFPNSFNTASVQAGPKEGEVRGSVLIIDDDPVFAILASETLVQAGYAAEIAVTPHEALASFEKARPDLVLLDVDLPGANGFDICSTLRAMSSGVDVPIVMVTGHDDTRSIAKAYEVGATDFIHKPVLWPTLPHRIGFILRAQTNLCALMASEQKNRALLQALPDTIYMVGGDGAVVEHIMGSESANHASMVGRRLEEIFRPTSPRRRTSPWAPRRRASRSRTNSSSAATRSAAGSKCGCCRSPTARC